MGQGTRSRLLLVLLCFLYIGVIAADQRVGRLQRRQENSDAPQTTTLPSRTANEDVAVTTSNESKETDDNGGKDTSSGEKESARSTKASLTSTRVTSAKSKTSSMPSMTSSVNGPAETLAYNEAQYNSTATPNLLPLPPAITPGFAVGGVILMLSGIVYTLIGIKNKWLHIFFSATYLASLSVTVLILYVMNPPVSNAIQGAYLVAVVMTGFVLGGASTVFTEMTEGLGCLLGGFCFSMWLLVLQPGGLVKSTGGKAIFIAAFTVVAYATSFSHYTRDHGLIVSTSFGGATAIVLGIDCFSRAGLKEFWAYLWNLNDNLFPLGATSYPLTRGMKVEIAAIIIIFLAGIVSQMKLWKVIKERREQRVSERLQDERTMEQEEENVGRRIETRNARERDQWEAVYGDKDAVPTTVEASQRDSGVGDMESQKKGARSIVTTLRHSDEDIEMSHLLTPTSATGPGLVMINNGQEGGSVTVRVARDLEPLADIDENEKVVGPSNRSSHISKRSSHHEQPEKETVWVVGADGEAKMERRLSRKGSKRTPNLNTSEVPKVVPLPFNPPTESNEERIADDRSSMATFAEDDEINRKRNSKHLSAGSAILHRLSSRRSKRDSRTFSRGEGISTEDLVIPRAVDDDDDRASSLAATMDGLSDDESMRSIRSSFDEAPDMSGPATEIEAPVLAQIREHGQLVETPTIVIDSEQQEVGTTRPVSAATEATDILNLNNKKEEATIKRSLTASTDPKADQEVSGGIPMGAIPEKSGEKTEIAATAISAVESKPSSITKERLPPQLSKVVMSYRTNEWAKHLSSADAPELAELKLAEYPIDENSEATELAAPVDVEALQQTPENAAPPPASRPASQMSSLPPNLVKSGSTQAREQQDSYFLRPSTSAGGNQDGAMSRSMSQQSLNRPATSQSNSRSLGFRSSSTPVIPQQIVESPIEDATSTYPPYPKNEMSPPLGGFGSTTSLMGQRESMLRTKHSYFGNSSALASTPEFPTQYHSSGPNSDAGSVYNHPNYSTPVVAEDDSMSLSARRSLMRQSSSNLPSSSQQTTTPPLSSLATFDSHQPRRQSSAPSPMAREQQLASWRANVAQDLQSGVVPKNTIERSRSALMLERQQEELKKETERKRRSARDRGFDEKMRRGNMLDAHKEALRKMQQVANKHV